VIEVATRETAKAENINDLPLNFTAAVEVL
jgi:hypothetical protein